MKEPLSPFMIRMSQWLHRIIAPTVLLWLYIPVLTALSVLASHDTDRTGADIVVQLSFPLILGVWVLADAHKRGRQLCYDYATFIFFGWPVMVPVYLFQTRGVRAFITLICFAGLCLLGIALGFLLSGIRDTALA